MTLCPPRPGTPGHKDWRELEDAFDAIGGVLAAGGLAKAQAPGWLEGVSWGPLEAPTGLADPDYARIFTQARIIAWQYGFALLKHGTGTRDLDLLMVPWEERAYAGIVPAVINRIAQVTGTSVKGEPGDKPHGRKAWTLFLPDMVRWVDLSVMPCVPRQAVPHDPSRTP